METIANKNENEVVIKIDVKAGASGNLLELAEYAHPTVGDLDCVVRIHPTVWPDAFARGIGQSDRDGLRFMTFLSHDCQRALTIAINRFTGQYEVTQNDFLATEVSELEIEVYRDMSL